MSLKNAVAIATYDFKEDAMGLGDFIIEQIANVDDSEICVLVFDDEGNCAHSATFEREILTDGSTVVNLIIKFDKN